MNKIISLIDSQEKVLALGIECMKIFATKEPPTPFSEAFPESHALLIRLRAHQATLSQKKEEKAQAKAEVLRLIFSDIEPVINNFKDLDMVNHAKQLTTLAKLFLKITKPATEHFKLLSDPRYPFIDSIREQLTKNEITPTSIKLLFQLVFELKEKIDSLHNDYDIYLLNLYDILDLEKDCSTENIQEKIGFLNLERNEKLEIIPEFFTAVNEILIANREDYDKTFQDLSHLRLNS